MSAPIIKEIRPSKNPVNFGETFTIEIIPDLSGGIGGIKLGVLKGHITDANGVHVDQEFTMTIQSPSDPPALPYTYFLGDPNNVGWTIIKDSVNPALFHVTAPAS